MSFSRISWKLPIRSFVSAYHKKQTIPGAPTGAAYTSPDSHPQAEDAMEIPNPFIAKTFKVNNGLLNSDTIPLCRMVAGSTLVEEYLRKQV